MQSTHQKSRCTYVLASLFFTPLAIATAFQVLNPVTQASKNGMRARGRMMCESEIVSVTAHQSRSECFHSHASSSTQQAETPFQCHGRCVWKKRVLQQGTCRPLLRFKKVSGLAEQDLALSQ